MYLQDLFHIVRKCIQDPSYWFQFLKILISHTSTTISWYSYINVSTIEVNFNRQDYRRSRFTHNSGSTIISRINHNNGNNIITRVNLYNNSDNSNISESDKTKQTSNLK